MGFGAFGFALRSQGKAAEFPFLEHQSDRDDDNHDDDDGAADRDGPANGDDDDDDDDDGTCSRVGDLPQPYDPNPKPSSLQGSSSYRSSNPAGFHILI